MLRIKELQDQVTQSTREIDRLGQELEEKEDAREREHAQAEVRTLPYCCVIRLIAAATNAREAGTGNWRTRRMHANGKACAGVLPPLCCSA
jgi:hypothetical protein